MKGRGAVTLDPVKVTSVDSRLLSYRHRVGLLDTDSCPECQLAPHTAQHLFECSVHPTALTPESLWTHPVEVATLLSGTSAFDGLPPLDPSPPPPPAGTSPPACPAVVGFPLLLATTTTSVDLDGQEEENRKKRIEIFLTFFFTLKICW